MDSNLDGTTSTYGSNGDGAYYPNYVKLGSGSSATCWRIVRTTGSGGIKMIYNGLYGATTTGSCANSMHATTTTGGQSSTYFNQLTSTTAKYIAYARYTYNSNYTSVQNATYGDIVGTDSSFSNNSTDSWIKNYLENTWFTNINDYLDYLEPSAGYCADSTGYTAESPSSQVLDSDTLSTDSAVYFGAYIRNFVSNQSLSLTCPRGTADLYTTNLANNGNKQLAYPVVLLTTDEAALAGSGRGASWSSSSIYNVNSYLRSGANFYLLSPNLKADRSYLYDSIVHRNGYLDSLYMYSPAGARPVISLKHSTAISGGSGTATDPWIVNAP